MKKKLVLYLKKWHSIAFDEFMCSEKCCMKLKEEPLKYIDKKYGYPIIGTMADESNNRQKLYLKYGGCNIFTDKLIISKPLSIWCESDIWNYIKMRNLSIADIYYKGAKRTGCMFCGFGCQFKDDNRLRLVYELYPKMYDKFMNYTNNGITYREALRKVLAINGLYLPDEEPLNLFSSCQ